MLAELSGTTTIAESARRAHLSPQTLRYHIKRGQIETVMTPLGRLVIRKSLEEFLQNRAGAAREDSETPSR